MIQRKLMLDGVQRDEAEAVRAELGGDDTLRDTVAQLIALPGAPVKIPTAALREVHAYRTAKTMPSSREGKLATLQLISHGAWTHTSLLGLKAKPTLDAFNTPTVLASLERLGDFLRANPNVVGNLASAGVGWELMSKHPQIGNFGGGAVIGDRIDIADWILAGDAEGFARMAIHEAGHATFQRLLFTGHDQQAPRDALPTWTEAANRGEERPHPGALDADGKRFYEAWQVLRHKPEFFYITDMPGTAEESRGAGRARYIAGQFTEFCADSFMHMALKKHELQAHVSGLPDDEAEIKAAWQSALSVLLKLEGEILGQVAGEAMSNLRFMAANKQLRTTLQVPEWETPDAGQVAKHLASLRDAWHELTLAGRKRQRAAALTTLDRYLLKVQRRRPAQEWFGRELGFADL